MTIEGTWVLCSWRSSRVGFKRSLSVQNYQDVGMGVQRFVMDYTGVDSRPWYDAVNIPESQNPVWKGAIECKPQASR